METILKVMIFYAAVLFFPYISKGQDFSEEIESLNGRCHKIVYLLHKTGNKQWKYKYELNDSGQITSQTNLVKTRLGTYKKRAKYTYKYDEHGRLVSEVILSFHPRKAEQLVVLENFYDAQDRLVKKIEHRNENDFTVDSLTYTGQKAEQIEVVKSFYTRDKLWQIKKYLFSYNDVGKLIKKEVFSTISSCYTYSYNYNNIGDLSEKRIHRSVTLEQNNKRSYLSALTLPIKSNDQYHSYTKYEYRYDYDANKNWVKKYTKRDDGEEYLEISRVIKYR